jgi:hypothetical protein
MSKKPHSPICFTLAALEELEALAHSTGLRGTALRAEYHKRKSEGVTPPLPLPPRNEWPSRKRTPLLRKGNGLTLRRGGWK